MSVQIDGDKGINKVQNGCVTSDSLAPSIRLPGAPTAATPTAGTNNDQLATTAFATTADAAVYSQLDAKKADKSYIDSLNAQPITYVNKAGHNNLGMLIGGKLYTTSGNTAHHSNPCTGRGMAGTIAHYGLDNLKQVVFPENASIKKVGGFAYSFAYALMDNGNLYTWGYNPSGQCGLGHTNPVATPTLAATGVVDVYDHPSNCGYIVDNTRLFIKKTDGYIYGAGYNGYGALGLGDTNNRSTFTQITSLGTNVTSLWNMGANLGCTVVQKSDNSIWVAGYNGSGQLGTGNTNNQSAFLEVTSAWGGGMGKTLKKVIGGFGYYDTAANTQASLGMLLDDGTNTVFKTCGDNGWGQLGNGSTSGSTSTPYTPNVGTGRIIDITGAGAGPQAILVLKADGTLYTFGYNGQGQLGNGTSGNNGTPTVVATGVTALLSDGITSHINGYMIQSAILKADGLYMCGYNGDGECGIANTTANITTFSKPLLPADFIVKLLGSYYTNGNGRVYVAVSTDNRAFTWGYNTDYGVTASSSNNVIVPANVIIPR